MTTRAKMYRLDGDVAVPTTKREALEWVRRVREDMRDVEQAIRNNDWDDVREFALDASGAAVALEGIADATTQMAMGERCADCGARYCEGGDYCSQELVKR